MSRTGVVAYTNPDGSKRREYRAPAEVFAAKSLETLADAPVTVGHLPSTQDNGLVTPQTWRKVAVGHAGIPSADAVERDGYKWLEAPITVHDAEALTKMGASELDKVSLAYTCDYVPTPGVTPEGEPYDGLQTNIRINSVALLDAKQRDRAGGTQVRLDSAGDEVLPGNPPKPRITPVKLTIDGIPYDSEADPVAFTSAVEKLQGLVKVASTRLDSLETDLKATKTKAETLEAERDLARAQLATTQLGAKYGHVLPKDYSFAGKTAAAVRLDAADELKLEIPKEKRDTDVYVEVMLDHALASIRTDAADGTPTGKGRGVAGGNHPTGPRSMVPKPAAQK